MLSKEIQDRREDFFNFYRENKPENCRKQLRVDDSFCFLGYMTEFYRMKTEEGEWVLRSIEAGDNENTRWWVFRLGDEECGEYPQSEIRDWYGMTDFQMRELARVSDDFSEDEPEVKDELLHDYLSYVDLGKQSRGWWKIQDERMDG